MPYKNKDDMKAAKRRYYDKNKALCLSKSKQARFEREQAAIKAKDKPCTDCGERYPYYVMQFDHINNDKIAEVSHLIRTAGIKRVLAEIEKCEVVCANCHAKRTYQRLKS